MKTILFCINLLIISLFFSSCNKEGVGGAASVTGNINVILINEITFDTLTNYPAQDERIYIVYGDNTAYDDDAKTSFDGTFKFDYLNKGDYKVYAYSECIFHLVDCPSESNAVVQEFTIGSSKEEFSVPTINITKYIK